MPIYALIDCNNFYASCERAFNPKLNGKPVIVLSNNDGCVIARSNEAKSLGIPMGTPYHQWKKFCKENNVYVFSSNYELYGDMSDRVMSTLRHFCPDMEVYSIDEAFLILDKFKYKDLKKFTLEIKQEIKQWTGIPVSIGFSHTKTLAKIANKHAKKNTIEGVFDLTSLELQNDLLDKFPVKDIWGIGSQLSHRLEKLNIHTAKQLRDADAKLLRKNFSVVMEKIIQELRGVSCIPLEDIQPKKQIMCSRSFGKLVTDLDELMEALSHYVANACRKLRNQQSIAQGIYVFLHTNFFRKNEPQYANQLSCYFPDATDDTGYIISVAKKCLQRIYKKGYQYKKVGILLLDLLPNTVQQYSLFSSNDRVKKTKLMKTIDQINLRMGQNAIFYCAEGIKPTWHIKREYRSPRYTTRLEEVLIAYC